METRALDRATAARRPGLGWCSNVVPISAARAANGREKIAPMGAPETILEVEFVGLTPEEQLKAIQGFPGGQRFSLRG
ncbi:hypothetical protein EMQ25_10155 [Arsenicitalea aurantiaca]|uniref:Uncharacterized protein n=1 Tax=Arsenicitalea aurantiaca TaxID=1783274 RepID=A0A433XAW0_9HYPH|nr:hypothetical protein [Arsenicitalea aurantiaca]RUT31216.1 hypothetical protein EMQ25_10155 [Arsenicitalea aurantiaca]